MANRHLNSVAGSLACAALMATASLGAQSQTRHPLPGQEGSPNVRLVSHIPLGGYLHVSDIDIEQELSRPYAYVSRGIYEPTGFTIMAGKKDSFKRLGSRIAGNLIARDDLPDPYPRLLRV